MENRPYILVPFDFRDESVLALKTALKIGKALSCRLEVVQFVPSNTDYFVTDPGIMVGYGAAVSQVVRETPDLPGIDAFLRIVDDLKSLCRDVHFRQVEGVPGVGPVESLTYYLEEEKPALVVVHKNLYKDSEFMPGPIMHRLVRHNQLPVLILEGEKPISFKNILIPTDLSGFLPQEEEFVSKWVEAFESTVHLLHIRKSEDGEVDSYNKKMEAMALKMGFEKFFIEDVVASKEADAILEYSQRINADLIMMKSYESSGLKGLLFGSITEDVVKRPSLPVLAVHT